MVGNGIILPLPHLMKNPRDSYRIGLRVDAPDLPSKDTWSFQFLMLDSVSH